MNPERLSSAIAHGQRALKKMPKAVPLSARAKMVTDAIMKVIEPVYAEAVTRTTSSRSRCPAYWWTDKIADLRKTCLQLRRRTQRVKRRDEDAAASTFKRAIKSSRRRCWRELGEELDADPWGLGYKIVTRKLASFASSTPRDAATMNNIVGTPFPEHLRRLDYPDPADSIEIPVFTGTELFIAVRSMWNKRAPWPDGLPAELLKAICGSHSRAYSP